MVNIWIASMLTLYSRDDNTRYFRRFDERSNVYKYLSFNWLGMVVKVSWNNLSDRWKDYFINVLHTTASMSKDENTKVGSLIIDTDRKVVVSSSWNDLPRGVEHTQERNSRPLKYLYTLHAEQGCLINALRLNVNVNGMTMLTTLGCCPSCSCSVVNSGLSEVVTPELDYNHVSCGDVYEHSVNIMKEGGVIWLFDNKLKLPNNFN